MTEKQQEGYNKRANCTETSSAESNDRKTKVGVKQSSKLTQNVQQNRMTKVRVLQKSKLYQNKLSRIK